MTNEITLFTGFASDDFDKGLEWVRAAKSFGKPPVVIDHGLSDEEADKLFDLRVEVVEPVVKTGFRHLDGWEVVLKHGKGPCCYCDADLRPDKELISSWDGKGMAAVIGDVSPYELLNPIVAIESRVRLASSIESGVNAKFGGHFLDSLVVGEHAAWRQLAGFSKLLLETGVTDIAHGLRGLNLNLYAAYTSAVRPLHAKS